MSGNVLLLRPAQESETLTGGDIDVSQWAHMHLPLSLPKSEILWLFFSSFVFCSQTRFQPLAVFTSRNQTLHFCTSAICMGGLCGARFQNGFLPRPYHALTSTHKCHTLD
uniref:Uncharacterized protein n=1 Tax=Sphaerodactylus townsendi TaxID=933632 RepID=A0ACB8G9C8_9SAUR